MSTSALPALPDGFRIERFDHGPFVAFSVYEKGGPTWDNGAPRDVITAELWPASEFQKEPRISWPSTSDKRPTLARALAVALLMAVAEST